MKENNLILKEKIDWFYDFSLKMIETKSLSKKGANEFLKDLRDGLVKAQIDFLVEKQRKLRGL